MPPGDQKERLITREFALVALAVVLHSAAYGGGNPVLPRFVRDALHGGQIWVGFVLGAHGMAAIFVRPWWGRLGDGRGARVVMRTGCTLGMLGIAAHTLVPSPGFALLARFMVGAGQAAVITGATTIAVTIAPRGRYGEAAGYVLVAFHVGLGLGPILGESVARSHSFDAAWLVLALLAAAAFVISSALPGRPPARKATKAPLVNRHGIVPGMVVGVGMVGFHGFLAFVPLYGPTVGLTRVAPVFLSMSMTLVVIRSTAGRLPDRLGPYRAGTIALTAATVGLTIATWWRAPAGIYVGVLTVAVGASLLIPGMVPAALARVEEERRSSALATFTACGDVGQATAGPLFGTIADGAGYRAAIFVASATPMLAMAILHLVLPRTMRETSARRPDGAPTLEKA